MAIDALWDVYRNAVRKLHTLEQQYKAESASEKAYACLTFNEMSTQYGVLNGITEATQAVHEDKNAVLLRAFEIFCEETGVPKLRGGKFGFWIPVEKELPEYGVKVIATICDGIVEEVELLPDGDWKFYDAKCSCFNEYNHNEVLAWMPLPEAYSPNKEKESDDGQIDTENR